MTAPANASGWFMRRVVHGAPGWITFLTYLFMLLPIAVLIVFAFNAGKSTVVWTGFSFRWFEKVVGNRNILDALHVSLIVAVASAAVSTAVGAIAAVAITRRTFPGRDALGAALAAPLVLPEIVLAVALLVFLSFAGVTLGYTTLIIGHVLVSIPFSTLIVRAAASSLDPRLEYAAADLGANEWQTFRMVTLPQLFPAIFTAFILSATLSFDNLVMSTFTSGVGTTTLPLRIYSMLKLGITPEINALGALMVLANVTILLLVMGRYHAGGSGYDLVNPSQYAVQILVNRGKLVELDHSKIETYDTIGPTFKEVSYDPGNKYSIPYVWGTTGLAYNKTCVDAPITSWKSLFDEKYKGRVYMLDNMLAAYIAGLQVNGFSANTSDPAEIEKATEALIAQKPMLAGYNSTNFADLVSSGEACIVQSWSSSVLQAIVDNPDVVYVLPEEGGTMWIDGYSILTDAPNPEAAYKFLSYILRPEVAAKTTELTKTATVVPESKALLPKEIAENPAVFPDEATLANADFILDLGDAMKLYQDGWTKVKAAP